VGHDADIVLLQEISGRAKSGGTTGVPAALGSLCHSLGFKIFFLPDTGDATDDAKARRDCSLRNGVAILWRAERLALQGDGFALARRTAGVRLLRLHDQTGLAAIVIHGLHGAPSLRVEQFRAAREYAAGCPVAIVGGDFNAVSCRQMRVSQRALDAADHALRSFELDSARCSHIGCALRPARPGE